MTSPRTTTQQQQQQQQQPPSGLHGQSPSPSMKQSMTAGLRSSSSSMSTRSTLPNRNVASETVEDAYVQFIMYCNPAVPIETDTAALREAFRVPPKSGGKSFSTFTLFQLIKRLETKEIKTWAELALKLGVEPPDQDKGQSSQKIQQYAVRLKRWMHSMHVDAFFEYLMDHSHPYWTEIPNDPTPVCEAGRDGVLAEDDMALRALLPQIRPRRGRKRPNDDDLSKSTSQRTRIDSPPLSNEYVPVRTEALGPWSAHPDGRSSYGCLDSLKMGASAPEWSHALNTTQTPVSAYPPGSMSAVTPTNRSGFWGDADPKPGVMPSKPKGSHRRHGAKVVSSAWRSGGPGGPGKTRGRPPMSKGNTDGPFVAFPAERSVCRKPSPENKTVQTPITPEASITQNTPPDAPPEYLPRLPQMQRPAKPSISLQVPHRLGGAVRLATPPPPVVMVNGDCSLPNTSLTTTAPPVELPPDIIPQMPRPPPPPPPPPTLPPVDLQAQTTLPDIPPATKGNEPPPQPNNIPVGMFENMEDRTNIEAVLGYFTHETANGDWVDAENNPIEGCPIAEAAALVHTTVERMWQTAPNQDAFLINLAALAGGRALMTTSKLKVKREAEYEDRATYSCAWEFRMGSIRGNYNMVQTVMYNRWKKTEVEKKESPVENVEPPLTEEDKGWEKRYRDLLAVSEKRDKELQDIRSGVFATLSKTFKDAKNLD